MAANPDLIHQIIETFRPLGHITARRMFSGAGIYVDGVIISIVRGDDTMFLKVDEITRPTFIAAGSAPFTYHRADGEKTLGSYWSCPADVFDDPDETLNYARLALAAAQRAAKSKATRAGASPVAGRQPKGHKSVGTRRRN